MWDPGPRLSLATLRSRYKMPMENRVTNCPGFPGTERLPGMQEFQCWDGHRQTGKGDHPKLAKH